MANLITATEFTELRNVSKKINTDRINEAITQAQQIDLAKLLGDFYFDVKKNASETDYSELLDGCEFTYKDETFEHVGLKNILADYAYARYIYNKNVNDTAFGVVTKNYQDGATVDRSLLKDIATQAQRDAGDKFVYTEMYIMSLPDLFARYSKNKKQHSGNGTFLNTKSYKL